MNGPNARRRLLIAASGTLVLAGCSSKIEWREFRWEDGGFSVLLPARPSQETRPVQLGDVLLTLTLFRTDPDGAAVAVGFAALPSGLDDAARRALLERARDAFLVNVGARVAGDAVGRPVALAGYPGIAFRGEGAKSNARLVVSGRVYATDRRFYQLLMISPPEHAIQSDAELFLDSLRLLK